MSRPTTHGENIAGQIQGEDAYGQSGSLTFADVWLILDNLHTHFMDTHRNPHIFSKWIAELEAIDHDLPII